MPDVFHGNGINLLCVVVGIVACALYLFFTLRSRAVRKRNGLEVDALLKTVVKSVVIVAVVVFFTMRLAQYKGIPMALLWVAVVVLIYTYITSKTGIDTRKIYFFAYANMGLLAGLAGILTIARMTSAQPTYGQNYEMDAIGSCFIGGASAYGGVGTVPGVIIGALLMGVINIGMSIMGVDANYQKVVKGLVLLAAVIFDVISKKKNS